jgi:hypothetical protein
VPGTAELAGAVLLTAAVGAPADLPPAGMPALAPAGSMDRPALPVAEPGKRARGALRWREDHLPLGKLRRHGDWAALGNLERAAARSSSRRGQLRWHLSGCALRPQTGCSEAR